MPTIKRRVRPGEEEATEETPVSRRRDRVERVEEPDDNDIVAEEPEDEPELEHRPARKDPAATNVRHSSSQDRDDDEPKSRAKTPEGVRGGWDGADETAKAGNDGSGVSRLKIEDKVELLQFLEPAPLLSYRQHWIDSGDDNKSRPYLCPGSKCPICGQGDNPAAYYLFNVLYLSGGSTPEVRVLQINQSAYKNLKEVFADRKTGEPVIDAEGLYASVKKTGKGFQTRTTFTKVKERDLKEDWPEVFEYFDFDDLGAMVDEAMEDLYTKDEVAPKPTSRRDLDKLAKYLDEPDED